MTPNNNYQCARCPKTYIYKGCLTAHLGKKHPLKENFKLTTAPKEAPIKNKDNVPTGTAQTMAQMPKNLDTQELNNLIEEEEEFFNAVEEFEHDIGINHSMIDWHRINFESSFGNSNEFSGRLATEVHHKKSEDCETNTKIVEKQRELMLKQDKRIQENHKIQREYKEKLQHHI